MYRVYDDGFLRVDPARWEASVEGRPLALSNTEFRLLSYLTQKAGVVCRHREILQNVWGSPIYSRELPKWHISRLRRKIGAERITSVPGVGYRYDPPEKSKMLREDRVMAKRDGEAVHVRCANHVLASLRSGDNAARAGSVYVLAPAGECDMCGKVCKLCEKPLETEDWQYQDNGYPVHTACRHATFFRKDDKVIHRFWESGVPCATVLSSHRVFGPFHRNALSDEETGMVEWLLVEYPNGKREEWAAWYTRKAPDWLVTQVVAESKKRQGG